MIATEPVNRFVRLPGLLFLRSLSSRCAAPALRRRSVSAASFAAEVPYTLRFSDTQLSLFSSICFCEMASFSRKAWILLFLATLLCIVAFSNRSPCCHASETAEEGSDLHSLNDHREDPDVADSKDENPQGGWHCCVCVCALKVKDFPWLCGYEKCRWLLFKTRSEFSGLQFFEDAIFLGTHCGVFFLKNLSEKLDNFWGTHWGVLYFIYFLAGEI